MSRLMPDVTVASSSERQTESGKLSRPFSQVLVQHSSLINSTVLDCCARDETGGQRHKRPRNSAVGGEAMGLLWKLQL